MRIAIVWILCVLSLFELCLSLMHRPILSYFPLQLTFSLVRLSRSLAAAACIWCGVVLGADCRLTIFYLSVSLSFIPIPIEQCLRADSLPCIRAWRVHLCLIVYESIYQIGFFVFLLLSEYHNENVHNIC